MVEQNASSQDPFRLDLTVATGALPDDLLGNPILLTRIHPAPRAAITENLSIQGPEGERFSRLSHYEAFDNLAELCLRVGTNATYSLLNLEGQAIWAPEDTLTVCSGIAREMPPDVFALDQRWGLIWVSIGNILLAERVATVADKRAENTRVHRRLCQELDVSRPSIIGLDHVRVGVYNPRFGGERQFYMPMDRGNALLAARVIEALEFFSNRPDRLHKDQADIRLIIGRVWNSMPSSERELFVTNRSNIFGSSVHIKRAVLGIMRRLTNVMGVTRETSGERFKIEGSISIGLHNDSPTEPSELNGFRPVFPPGTSREVLRQHLDTPLSEESIANACVLLDDVMRRAESLSHRDALAVLDLITDSATKRALRQEIRSRGLGITSARVLESLRSLVADSLGEGFSDAWRNRMIAGNNATGVHKVRQVAGQLPIVTNTDVTIRRWYVGDPRS